MTINDDWLIREIFDNLVNVLDKVLEHAKKNGLLEDSSFQNWTDDLYKLIYKYTNNG